MIGRVLAIRFTLCDKSINLLLTRKYYTLITNKELDCENFPTLRKNTYTVTFRPRLYSKIMYTVGILRRQKVSILAVSSVVS